MWWFDSFTIFSPVESSRSQYLIFLTISSPCWPTLKRHSEQPELLFHTQFLWWHRAVSVVTPRDFTFLLPHSCKSEYFSFRASVLSGIYWRLSWKRRNVWERRNMSLLSQCRCDFCLWKMTFWNKFFHPDGFSFSRKMMENSATTLSHYAAVRSGKENSLKKTKVHMSLLQKALKSLEGQCDVPAAQLYNTDGSETDRKRRLTCPSVVLY